MNYAPYKPQFIEQGFTGVRPDARGRGLGKWLKAAMLLHVREIYPGLKTVVTRQCFLERTNARHQHADGVQ